MPTLLDEKISAVVVFRQILPTEHLSLISIADLLNLLYALLIRDVAFLFELLLTFCVKRLQLLINGLTLGREARLKESFFILVQELRNRNLDVDFHFL